MKEIIPIIGHWYKAECGVGCFYIIRLDSIDLHSKKWKPINAKDWSNNSGGFTKLIGEIPCPEEFIEQYKIVNYEIY